MRELNIAQHTGQYIVEIVSNTTRKVSDGLHFFCLTQLRFQLSALIFGLGTFGYIANAGENVRLPLLFARHIAGLNITTAAVAMKCLVYHCRELIVFHRLQKFFGFLTMPTASKVERFLANHFVARVPVHVFNRRIDVNNPAIGIKQR